MEVSEHPPCDVNKPNKEDAQDCHVFYQCDQGVNGSKWHKKTCGINMMYNPLTQVCDWPYNVFEIRKECIKGEGDVHIRIITRY